MTTSINYILKKSKNAHLVRISINGKGEVVVTKPWYMPMFVVDQFINKNEEWIKSKLVVVKKANPVKAKDTLWYLGKQFKLEYKIGKFNLSFDNEVLVITSYSKASAKRNLEIWLKKDANQKILEALKKHSVHMEVTYKDVRLKDQSSRWGSCSTKKNLNFNWRLIMTPPQVLDYVVIHELAHLKHMNHSRQFWLLVEKYSPEYREHRRWLHKYGRQLKID